MIRAKSDSSNTLTARAVVVGGGFAGAATAYHLGRRGLGDVVLIEKEEVAGVHSSGRNAAMVRQVTSGTEIARLARSGGIAIRRIAREREAAGACGFYHQTGSLLLARNDDRKRTTQKLRRDAENARAGGLDVFLWDRPTTVAKFPILRGSEFDLACYCPSDGVVDIASLLEFYLKGIRRSGGRILFRHEAVEILADADGTRGVRVGDFEIRAPVVVNASGGWAPTLKTTGHASTPAMRPTRRHLFVTPPLPWVSRDWPFIWDLTNEIYFRPESGGLLLSACDVLDCDPTETSTLEDERVQSGAVELLKKKLDASFPTLSGISIQRGWTGIRTLTEDGRFVIGPEPELPGLFWVAGLGGHGVTTSYPVGELAAELVLDPTRDEDNPFSPARFARPSRAAAEGGARRSTSPKPERIKTQPGRARSNRAAP